MYNYYLDFDEILATATTDKGARLHAVTLRIGQRMFTYYFVDKVPDDHFFFRNAFNVTELITLYGKTTKKFTSQRSEAVCSGRSIYYDLRNELVFEFESARLRKDTAEALMQLFISPAITKDHSTQNTVVIKDINYEIADDDEEKRTVKFTWKYADNRILVDHTYSTNAKTFTDEFTDIYD